MSNNFKAAAKYSIENIKIVCPFCNLGWLSPEFGLTPPHTEVFTCACGATLSIYREPFGDVGKAPQYQWAKWFPMAEFYTFQKKLTE